MICAACGLPKEGLCESPRSNGVKQPRVCKECLLASMHGTGGEVKDAHWIAQLLEAQDTESLRALIRQAGGEDTDGQQEV